MKVVCRFRPGALIIILSVLMLMAWQPRAASASSKKKLGGNKATSSAAVTITAPADSASVSGTVSITAKIGSGATWINIYVDGSYLASSPPSTFSWNSTSVINGNHTISASAFSSSGALVGSASITVSVQNQNSTPAVTLTSPTNNSTVSGNATLTAQTNASVGWVNFYIDGSYFASSPPLSMTWDTTSLPDGSHTASVNAYDRSSNLIGSATATVTVSNHAGGNTGPVTVRSTSIGSTSSSSDSVTINAPSGVSAGDVLVAQVAVRGGSGAPLTGPPGWTMAAHNNSTSSIVQAIFYHVVPASPAEPGSYTFTWSNTVNDAAGAIADYVGVDNVTPIDDVNGTQGCGATSITAPGLSVPASHTSDHLLAMYAIAMSSGVTLPSSLIPQWNFRANSYGIEIAMGDLNQTTTNSVTETAKFPAAACAIGQELALIPANVSHLATADRTSSNAPGVVVSGTTVSAMLPMGSDDSNPINASQVVLENATGTLPAPLVIHTDRVNACGIFASTGETLCSGQGGTVDFIPNAATSSTVVSDGISAAPLDYTGGDCAGCGIAADDFLGEGILASNGGFQLVNPNATSISAPIPGNGEPVPVDFGYDPVGHRILSANYKVTNISTFASSPPHFEIFNLFRSTNEVFDLINDSAFFEPAGRTCTGTGTSNSDILPDTTAIDTATNIAYVSFHAPAVCFTNPIEDIALFDLSQAKYATTGPVGGWDTAGKQVQTLNGLTIGGITAMSVVSGAHLAIVSGQFSSSLVGALRLPATSGSGVPAIGDWVQAQMPNDPSGKPWSNWHQPSGLASYTSPNSGKAMGVMMNFGRDANSNPIGPTYVAVVDLNALLSASRDATNHMVSSSVNLVTSGIVRFVRAQ